MFDTLTLDDLYDLHASLNQEGARIHARFMALPSVISDEGNILAARTAEISGSMDAVYAEITRRQQEERAGTRALRDLRNQKGLDA